MTPSVELEGGQKQTPPIISGVTLPVSVWWPSHAHFIDSVVNKDPSVVYYGRFESDEDALCPCPAV